MWLWCVRVCAEAEGGRELKLVDWRREVAMKSCYYLNISKHTVIYELDIEANTCNDSKIHSVLRLLGFAAENFYQC